MDIKYLPAQVELKTEGKDAGQVSAVFSTFDVVDRDGDIVKASVFTDGEAVPMTWSHIWSEIIGKGIIHVEENRARLDGAFFMETVAGLDKFKTVKAMGDLQEWSWGFRVVKADWVETEDEWTRIITEAEVFEVSPVLKGAGLGTFTQSIKSGQPFADQLDATLAVVTSMVKRAQSLADLRGEKGRRLSDRYRDRLAKGLVEVQGIAEQLDALLKSQEPQDDPDVAALFARIEHTLDAVQFASMEA